MWLPDEAADPLVLSILETTPDCVELLELDGALVFMSANGLAAMEISDFEGVRGKPWPDLWPEVSRDVLRDAVRKAASGTTATFEARCPTSSGETRWWAVTVSPILGPNRAPRRLLAVSRDITGRVRAEKEREDKAFEIEAVNTLLAQELSEKERLLAQQKVLLAEIDHRVKNSFALITGILRLQMRTLGGGEAFEAIEDAANRIASLAKLHEQLHFNPERREVPLAPYLRSLVDGLADSMAPEERVRLVTTDIVERTAPAEVAVSIGLVANELVANALKNGRPGEENCVEVALVEAPDGAMRLHVSDAGLGLPPGFDAAASQGLGMKICAIYSQQLGGAMSYVNRLPHGAEFTVSFRL